MNYFIFLIYLFISILLFPCLNFKLFYILSYPLNSFLRSLYKYFQFYYVSYEIFNFEDLILVSMKFISRILDVDFLILKVFHNLKNFLISKVYLAFSNFILIYILFHFYAYSYLSNFSILIN